MMNLRRYNTSRCDIFAVAKAICLLKQTRYGINPQGIYTAEKQKDLHRKSFVFFLRHTVIYKRNCRHLICIAEV